MEIPIRTLWAEFKRIDPDPPKQTPRQERRERRILFLACVAFAEFGAHSLTLPGLAMAMGIGASTFRRHFPDLECLLAHILTTHVRALIETLMDIPETDPDCAPKRRAAYFVHTRTDQGLTPEHQAYLRNAHLLPDDLRPDIEDYTADIADLLGGGEKAEQIRRLLDTPALSLARTEQLLGTPIRPLPKPETTAPETAPEDAPEKTPENATKTIPETPPATPPPDPIEDLPSGLHQNILTKAPPMNRTPAEGGSRKDNDLPGAWVSSCGIPGVRNP